MNSSNGEWGIIQLVNIVDKFPEYRFNIIRQDKTAYTDRELYFQFIIRVYKFNIKHENEDFVSNSNCKDYRNVKKLLDKLSQQYCENIFVEEGE